MWHWKHATLVSLLSNLHNRRNCISSLNDWDLLISAESLSPLKLALFLMTEAIRASASEKWTGTGAPLLCGRCHVFLYPAFPLLKWWLRPSGPLPQKSDQGLAAPSCADDATSFVVQLFLGWNVMVIKYVDHCNYIICEICYIVIDTFRPEQHYRLLVLVSFNFNRFSYWKLVWLTTKQHFSVHNLTDMLSK